MSEEVPAQPGAGDQTDLRTPPPPPHTLSLTSCLVLNEKQRNGVDGEAPTIRQKGMQGNVITVTTETGFLDTIHLTQGLEGKMMGIS